MSASNTGRRLSLLTGSSLVAASLSAFAFTGASFAPTTAHAYDECTPSSGTTLSDGPGGTFDVTLNGTTADTFICSVTVPSISYPTTSGTLTLQLRNNVTTTSGGLVVTAAPTATTSITISRIFDDPAGSGDPSLFSTSGAGVQVTRAAGGTITVNLSDPGGDTADTPMVISGATAGVLLQNVGSGSTSFTMTTGTVTGTAGAGIDMSTSGTGGLTLTAGDVAGTTAGARLRNTGIAGGAVTATIRGSVVATAGAGLDLSTTGTGAISVTSTGDVTGTTAAILISAGSSATITNNEGGSLLGVVTMNNTGASTVTNSGSWTFAGTSFLGGGATSLTNDFKGVIVGDDGSTLDFGTGVDTFANNGRLAAGGAGPSVFTVSGLETWTNSGGILFGADETLLLSDGEADDRVIYGGTFNGAGLEALGSRLEMDVDFRADQTGCAASLTADCFDLRGGTTAGVTSVFVNTVAPGMAERIVLVDVAGAGTSGAGHFILSDGVIDGGFFLYTLEYDAAAQQHALTASDLSGGGLELAVTSRGASEPWRVATGMWHDRQADLRSSLRGPADGYAPGAWIKIAGGFVDESRHQSNPSGAEFNMSYAQDTTALVGGVDLIRVLREDSAWVLGVTAGRLESTLDFSTGPSVLDMEGHSFGGYASILSGPMFFDAIVNAANLDITRSALGGQAEGAAKSIGYQLEAGYRLFRINEDGAWFEPLAALTYVKTDVEDLEIDQVSVEFDDAGSLRAALGARVGGDLVMDAVTASFSATGRLWKELDGDSSTQVTGALSEFALSEAGLDNLGDLGFGVSLFTLGGRLSAHLSYSILFKEDYQNTDASFGVRYNW